MTSSGPSQPHSRSSGMGVISLARSAAIRSAVVRVAASVAERDGRQRAIAAEGDLVGASAALAAVFRIHGRLRRPL